MLACTAVYITTFQLNTPCTQDGRATGGGKAFLAQISSALFFCLCGLEHKKMVAFGGQSACYFGWDWATRVQVSYSVDSAASPATAARS